MTIHTQEEPINIKDLVLDEPPKHQNELNLDPTIWKGMNSLLRDYKQNKNWSFFVDYAFAMTVLAAKDVQITAEGVKIIMPEEPVFGNQLLPETRSF